MPLPLLGIGLGLAGAGLLGSALSQYASDRQKKKQSDIMADAMKESQSAIDRYYQQNLSTQQPLLQAGTQALNEYRGLLSTFNPQEYVSPDVGAFRYDRSVEDFYSPASSYEQQQAMDSILSNAAVGGLVKSGGTLKALQERGQQIAAQRYDQARQAMMQDRAQAYQQFADRAQYLQQLALQRLQAMQNKLGMLSGLAGMGQQSANTISSLTADTGQSLANIMMGQSQARAQGVPIGALGYAGAMTQGLLPVGSYMLGQWAGRQ